MASMLVRASRGAARAAAASSAASRCTAAAASSSCAGSGSVAGAAAYRLLLHGSPAVASSPPFGRAGLSSHSNSDGDERVLHNDIDQLLPKRTGRVEFEANDKDLESDEALWALYERWCKAWGQERDRDEMLRRFDHFKKTALDVDRWNKEAIRDGQSVRFAINMFADGKLRELCSNKMRFPVCEFLLFRLRRDGREDPIWKRRSQ